MTKIEWTDVIWNPTKGCSKVTEGCSNCYAIKMAARLEAMGNEHYTGLTRRSGANVQWTGQVNIDHKSIYKPLSWKKPRKIFVNSMSDLFHEEIDVSVLREIWKVMKEADWHQFQVLTKRADYMRTMVTELGEVPDHIWLGVSVESEKHVNRIDVLKSIPALVRFVSFEPLIGAINTINLEKIHWVIVGGESGKNARPMREEWIAPIEQECRRAGVRFFFKQWGGVNKKKTGRLWKNKTWDEYPDAAV